MCIKRHTITLPTAKTKFAKFLFVSHSYKYCKKHNIPLKIVYFALEESVEKFWITILCDMLYERYNKTITYYQYMGFHEGLTEEIKSYIDILQPELDEMKNFVEVVDYISSPTAMFKKVKDVMLTLGKVTKEVTDKDELGNTWKSFEYEHYNEKQIVIVVVDHAGLQSPEQSKLNNVGTLHLAMSKWSEYVVRYICKKFRCITCNVHQQLSSGDNEVNVNGNSSLLLPSLSKFGDNLLIARDYMVVFGLFNPTRYQAYAKNYNGYNMEILKNKFRLLSLLKHRDGADNVTSPLYFNGEINYFKELPLPTETEKLNQFYKTIK